MSDPHCEKAIPKLGVLLPIDSRLLRGQRLALGLGRSPEASDSAHVRETRSEYAHDELHASAHTDLSIHALEVSVHRVRRDAEVGAHEFHDLALARRQTELGVDELPFSGAEDVPLASGVRHARLAPHDFTG